jgi:hypothetical protein
MRIGLIKGVLGGFPYMIYLIYQSIYEDVSDLDIFYLQIMEILKFNKFK